MQPTVFFDLDGTLVPTEMHQAVLFFVQALPTTWFRKLLIVIFTPFAMFCGVLKFVRTWTYVHNITGECDSEEIL